MSHGKCICRKHSSEFVFQKFAFVENFPQYQFENHVLLSILIMRETLWDNLREECMYIVKHFTKERKSQLSVSSTAKRESTETHPLKISGHGWS